MTDFDRLEVANDLADEMDERFIQLVERLANKTPVTDITDEEINAEVRAVRSQRV